MRYSQKRKITQEGLLHETETSIYTGLVVSLIANIPHEELLKVFKLIVIDPEDPASNTGGYWPKVGGDRYKDLKEQKMVLYEVSINI